MKFKRFELVKLHEIHFIDGGVLGEVYQENGTKYYSVTCTIRATEGKDHCELGNVVFRLKEEELNKLLNEPFYFDRKKKTIWFEQENPQTNPLES